MHSWLSDLFILMNGACGTQNTPPFEIRVVSNQPFELLKQAKDITGGSKNSAIFFSGPSALKVEGIHLS